MLALAVSLGASPAAGSARDPHVKIETGRLAGFLSAGVNRFLGIPFAAPPIAELRWRAPRPAARWAGLRQATTFGPACAQNGGFGVFAAPSASEDCLTLNIFAPANRAAKPRPVMVWIYGGAHYSGGSADYDGSALAREQDAVVVTVNYRLGVLGYFAHPAINGVGPTDANFGLLDQRAALQWVQRNIRQFGGDASNVTLFGQSAGGSSILAALVAPSFRGLFHRAIIQSGGRLVTTPLDVARTKGKGLAAKFGCRDHDAACLRAIDLRDMLRVQDAYLTGVTLDGKLLTRAIGPALETGQFNRVPIMIGVTKDEQAFTLAAREMAQGPQTPEGYRRDIETTFGAGSVEAVLNRFPISASGPSATEIRTWHGARACISRWIGHATRQWTGTYLYEFVDDTAPSYYPPMSFAMGAYHTAELQYLFPLYRGGLGTAHPLNSPQEALARQMRGYWGSFARTGVPTGPIQWPAFGSREPVLHLGPQTTLQEGYGAARGCHFWDRIIRYR